MNKRPTVHDVAREAGVTIGSVSKALNGGKHVSAALRARVLTAVEQLGYQPHASARSLRMGSSRTIGCMVSTTSNPYYALLVDVIEKRLRAEGYMLLLANSHNNLSREREILGLFERRGMDGAIVTTSFGSARGAPNPITECRLPLVVIDRELDPPRDCVLTGHRQGVRSAVRELLSLGHRRIALFTPGARLRPGIERAAGFRQAFRDAGLTADERHIAFLDAPTVSGYDEMKRRLDGPKPPTALIGLGTGIVSGALRAVRERGLRVPQDFSVVAIGVHDLMEYADPPLTTLRFDLQKSGELAAELLIDRLMNGAAPAPRCVDVAMELIMGGSCARVPRR